VIFKSRPQQGKTAQVSLSYCNIHSSLIRTIRRVDCAGVATEAHPAACGSPPRKCAWPTRHAGAGCRDFSDALISWFSLPDARICERLLTSASRVPICQECLSSFVRIPSIVMRSLWRPLRIGEEEGESPLCLRPAEDLYLDRARSFAVYADAVVRAILLLKFEQIEPLVWFSERLTDNGER